MQDVVERLIERHRAFWERENDRPLVQISSGARVEDLQQLTEPLPEGPLSPDKIDPSSLVRPYSDPVRPGSDFFQPLAPPNMSWTEGMIGCPISVASGESTWAGPADAEWPKAGSLPLTADNPWQRLLLHVLGVMTEAAGDRLPIAQPMMRGPADMVGAFLGQARMCTEIYLDPPRLKRLLRECAGVWIQSYRQLLRVIPSWHGGYCNVYGIWSPGTAMRMQEDISALLSPRHYREFLLPLDRLICEEANFPVMHMHSGSLRFLPMLLEADWTRGIQVAVDAPPSGPSIPELVPILRDVLERKPLILVAYDPLSLADAKQLVGSLPAPGLACKVNLATQEEADEFYELIAR